MNAAPEVPVYVTPWTDCRRLLPYRDRCGRWQLPLYTQFRAVVVDGRTLLQYCERAETIEEWRDRQW